jgi:hypothetical protein
MATAVLSCALSAALIPGCTSMTGEKKKAPADPILGEVHPQNTNPYGPVPPPPKSGNESTGNKMSAVPPPPPDPITSPSPTSPAYLASRTKPLAGSVALAINDGVQQTNNNAPVVRPVQKDPAFVNGSWVSAPGSPGTPPPPPPPSNGTSTPGPFEAQPSNFVDPQAELLKSRGITNYRFEPQPDGKVRLFALAPHPNNPQQMLTLDVTTNDYPSAVQALILKLEQTK